MPGGDVVLRTSQVAPAQMLVIRIDMVLNQPMGFDLDLTDLILWVAYTVATKQIGLVSMASVL